MGAEFMSEQAADYFVGQSFLGQVLYNSVVVCNHESTADLKLTSDVLDQIVGHNRKLKL